MAPTLQPRPLGTAFALSWLLSTGLLALAIVASPADPGGIGATALACALVAAIGALIAFAGDAAERPDRMPGPLIAMLAALTAAAAGFVVLARVVALSADAGLTPG